MNITTETKIFLGIIVACVILVIGGAFWATRNQPKVEQTDSGQVVQVDLDPGLKIGSESAKVKLVEFGDFQCPACGAFYPFVRGVLEKHPNDIYFVFKQFPLVSVHKNAYPAATFIQVADKHGKFKEAEDALYTNQNEWSDLNDATDYFVKVGEGLGISADEIKNAIKNDEYKDIIHKSMDQGGALGVSGTPTFFVNGKRLYVQQFSDLEKAVDDALK